MFPRRYFTGRYFAPTYFPPVVGEAPPSVTPTGGHRRGYPVVISQPAPAKDRDDEFLMLFVK